MHSYYFGLILIAIVYYCSISTQIKYNRAITHTLLFLLIYLSISQIENTLLRNCIGIPVITILSLDFLASQFYSKNFDSRLEYSFALSIIETDKNEARGMLLHYLHYIMLYPLYLLVSITLINILPLLPQGYSNIPSVILVIYLLTLLIKSYLHNKRKNNVDSFIIRFIEETPVSNVAPFLEVYQDRKVIRSLSSTKPSYTFKNDSTDIDTYVIVLGESARPNNMSMYGYKRQTTPCCDAQKKSMLIFNRAYSPSSVTATAVPIALSKASITNLQFTDYSDNIVHIANHLGLKTFWFSNQGQYGNYSNAITGMAMNCHEKEWLPNGSYDKDLLPLFKKALDDKERKLIILHLYGSHIPCEHRYPATDAIFNGHTPDDHYDNSIHYTDSLLGDIFDSLQDMRASVLYFSDHGLERFVQGNKVKYQHGGANATLDAFMIPMCTWYSPIVKDSHHTGEINGIWLSENNYFFIKNWLGATDTSTLETLTQKNNQIKVMSTTGKINVLSE